MTLKDYNDINPNAKKNLLLGNGFSIGVSPKFSYSSLREICVNNNYLLETDNQLFDKFNSNDFEFILNQLSIAASVNEILEIDCNTPLERHDAIRDALIKAVKFVHSNFDEINSQWIESVFEEFKEFKTIFTTNYDLLIYWIAGHSSFKDFVDYFWSDGLTFDQFNTEINSQNETKRIPLLYLHGALFMYKELNKIKKIKAKDKNKKLLDSIEEKWNQNHIPIFVSEGSSSAKKNAISSDPYLTFAFSSFLDISKGITIFGHSLSIEADGHIVSAINENDQLENIAVSVYRGYRGNKTDDDIEHEINSIKLRLRKHQNNIEFFDSATCPLSYP